MNAKQRKAFEEMGNASKQIVGDMTHVGNKINMFVVPDGTPISSAIMDLAAVVANVAALQQAILLTVENMANAMTPTPRKRTTRSGPTDRMADKEPGL